MIEAIIPSFLGLGFFSAFLLSGLIGVIYFVGQIYTSYKTLARNDLTSEQRIIYLLIIWLIPLGWIIYLILGTEKTQRLFSDIKLF